VLRIVRDRKDMRNIRYMIDIRDILQEESFIHIFFYLFHYIYNNI